MADTFEALGLKENLICGLKKQKIVLPTDIQKSLIPVILAKKDVAASSETGTGKTLAYLLPLFMMIDKNVRATQAFVLTPTHELAVQVTQQIRLLSENSEDGVSCALIIGGANTARQLESLKKKPHIVVGSCGRILELIQKRKISAHTVKTIVIDEADRLLDSLNFDAVKAVVKTTLKERRLVMVSAVIDEKTKKAASELSEDVLYLSAERQKLPKKIGHCFIVSEKRKKLECLRKLLAALKPERTIVFINNKENIEINIEKFNFHGIKACGIYGDAGKDSRKNALEAFRAGRSNVLFSSDISARGLDIPEVDLVVNLDIPEDPNFYLHRAGRTGRMERNGLVVSLVTPYEKRFIGMYKKGLNVEIKEKELSFGKLTDTDNNKGGTKNGRK